MFKGEEWLFKGVLSSGILLLVLSLAQEEELYAVYSLSIFSFRKNMQHLKHMYINFQLNVVVLESS